MKRRIGVCVMAALVVLPGSARGAGPAIDGAVSFKTHDTAEYGLDLPDAVEPRAGGVTRLVVTFDTAIDPGTVEGHIAIEDETGTAYTGFTWSLDGAALTILPEPALTEHCFRVDFAGLESTAGEATDATMQFVALEGDVTGDGIVNSIDYSSVKPYYGAAVDDSTFLYDLTLDSVINSIDGSFVKPRFGHAVSCGEVVATQLAGNSLAGYPYFEYVKAFNEDAGVEVAIDPTRYPDVLGQAADIYVVEAKTASEWAADPALLDATPGGPQTETFGGTTIQENTFSVVGPYDLESAVYDPATGDYTGLGHGYDVVLDMNQNGVLDGGDYIDGPGAEAGLYVLHDTTQPGPLDVTEVTSYSVGAIFGIPSYYTNENLYYPTDIAGMDPLPLIVVGHGGGHNYQWYDHIGYHMASYGYIVMSHQNCYGPPECTLGHTDAILELQDQIAGGVLDGRIDATRIIWIGHSLGGMGVVRAFDALVDGAYSPTHYSIDSIVLVSAMLPNSSGGPGQANPHHSNFHLWTAAGDTDISGHPGSEQTQTFMLHDRATRYRMSTVLQGTGHAWFHDGPEDPAWFTGPCCIGRENTHRIQLGLFLPLIKYFAEGNVPASDFFWRQYERFHPLGVDTSDPCIVVTNEYRNGAEAGNFFIDDYQSGDALEVSSSGGAVTFSVHDVQEGRLDDLNSSFTWMASDPFNGATHGSTADTTRGVVFEWDGEDAYCEWEVVPEARDFSDYVYLSFRGAQGTRHPYTTEVLEDLTFTVTLLDGTGHAPSIDIGAYGGGLEEPYQRTGAGSGVGWHDDFEVVRIRITDFLTNGSGLNLEDVVAVRFDFGPSWGSPEGRIVLDELMLTCDHPPGYAPASPGGADPRLAGGPLQESRLAEPATTLAPQAEPAVLDSPPGVPDTPLAAEAILYARPFTLEQGYDYFWSRERPQVTRGMLVVLEADRRLLTPRSVAMPVLYAGDRPAERLNFGHESGRVVAIVPGDVDLTEVPIWFGAAGWPWLTDTATAAAQRLLAEQAGIEPFTEEQVKAARAKGGNPIRTADQRALLRDHAAELILDYSPPEKNLAEDFRVPVVARQTAEAANHVKK